MNGVYFLIMLSTLRGKALLLTPDFRVNVGVFKLLPNAGDVNVIYRFVVIFNINYLINEFVHHFIPEICWKDMYRENIESARHRRSRLSDITRTDRQRGILSRGEDSYLV